MLMKSKLRCLQCLRTHGVGLTYLHAHGRDIEEAPPVVPETFNRSGVCPHRGSCSDQTIGQLDALLIYHSPHFI